jgi:hypothetical protein
MCDKGEGNSYRFDISVDEPSVVNLLNGIKHLNLLSIIDS